MSSNPNAITAARQASWVPRRRQLIRGVMRFKATPFTHPEYEALKLRSEFWATVWGMGHVFFVLFSALSLAAPLAVALVVMFDTEIPKERFLEVGVAAAAACLTIAAIGFVIRGCARKKGERSDGSC